MSFLRLPARASRAAVLGVMASAVTATGYVTYQHVVLQQPMRLKLGGDGVWRWMSREEYLEVRLEKAKATALSSPDSYSAKYLVVALALALEKEIAARHSLEAGAAGGGAAASYSTTRKLRNDDLTL